MSTTELGRRRAVEKVYVRAGLGLVLCGSVVHVATDMKHDISDNNRYRYQYSFQGIVRSQVR